MTNADYELLANQSERLQHTTHADAHSIARILDTANFQGTTDTLVAALAHILGVSGASEMLSIAQKVHAQALEDAARSSVPTYRHANIRRT